MIKLFDKYASWKVLRYFALHPSEEVYVKEIAKKLNLSSGTCSKALRELLESQILEKNILISLNMQTHLIVTERTGIQCFMV